MKCSKCNHENKEGFSFCEKCGAKLDRSGKICKKCGKENQKDATFCLFCGEKLEPEKKVKQEKGASVCPNCGKEVAENSNFCLACGTNLKKEEGKEKVVLPKKKEKKDAKHCPKCGNLVQEDNKFCLSCGTKLETDDSVKELPKEESKEKKETKKEEHSKTEIKMETMKCPNCKKEYEKGTKFCLACGTKLETDDGVKELPKEEIKEEKEKKNEEPPKTEIKIEVMKCPNCNKEYTMDTKFCLSCGTKLEKSEILEIPDQEKEDDSYQEEPKKQKKKKSPIKILLFLILFLFILAFAWCGYRFVTYKVPSIKGLTQEEAIEKLEKEHFKVTIKESDKEEISFHDDSNLFERILRKPKGTLYVPKELPEDDEDGWSEWQEELPEDITEENYIIEEEKQYRSRTIETKRSDQLLEEEDEWTFLKEEPVYSEWERLTSTEKKEENENTKLIDTIVVYIYYHYENTYADNTTGIDSILVNKGIRREIKTNVELESVTDTIKDHGNRESEAKKTNVADNEKTNIWWLDKEETNYIYEERSILATNYVYVKYTSDWSEYQKEELTPSDHLEVESKTLYRYKER